MSAPRVTAAQVVAHEVRAAALPRGTWQRRLDGVDEARVGVRGDHLDPRKAAGNERAQTSQATPSSCVTTSRPLPGREPVEGLLLDVPLLCLYDPLAVAPWDQCRPPGSDPWRAQPDGCSVSRSALCASGLIEVRTGRPAMARTREAMNPSWLFTLR